MLFVGTEAGQAMFTALCFQVQYSYISPACPAKKHTHSASVRLQFEAALLCQHWQQRKFLVARRTLSATVSQALAHHHITLHIRPKQGAHTRSLLLCERRPHPKAGCPGRQLCQLCSSLLQQSRDVCCKYGQACGAGGWFRVSCLKLH